MAISSGLAKRSTSITWKSEVLLQQDDTATLAEWAGCARIEIHQINTSKTNRHHTGAGLVIHWR